MFITNWNQCLIHLKNSAIGEEIIIETKNPEVFSEALFKSILFFKEKYELKTSIEIIKRDVNKIVQHELAHFKVAQKYNIKVNLMFKLLFTMDETYKTLSRDACIFLLEDSLLEEDINACENITFLKQMLEVVQAPKDMSESDIEQSELLQDRINVLMKSNSKIKSC